MTWSLGETVSETFSTGVASETFTRTASFVNGASTVFNPAFTDLGGGFYRYSYTPATAGSYEWAGSGSSSGPLTINFEVEPVGGTVVATLTAGTWTYAADMALARDRIRLLVGDTDPADPLIADQEIALYTTGGAFAQATDVAAAIGVLRAAMAKTARRVDIAAGGTNVRLSQQYDRMEKSLAYLMQQAAEGAVPYAGGISRADVIAREDDTDRVPPYFARTTDEWPNPVWRGR